MNLIHSDFWRSRFGLAICVLVFSLLTCPKALQAQQKHTGSPNSLAMDVVFQKDGKTLYGVLHDVTADGLVLVLRREWFRDNHQAYYDSLAEAELKAAEQAEDSLIERIEQWKAERPDDLDLLDFLSGEQAAAEKRKADLDLDSLRFTFVKIASDQARRVVLQDAAERQVGLLAWKHNLTDAEVRPAEELRAELIKQNIEIGNNVVDFSDQVPGTPQSKRDWAMRKNIVEFLMRESLEFQGTGDTFFKKGERPAMAGLLSQLMQGGLGAGGSIQQIGEELGIPEFTRNRKGRDGTGRGGNAKTGWWKKQAEIADKEGFRSFSITRLNQNLASPIVKVDVAFIGKDENDEWQLVAEFKGSANADEQSDDDVEALMDDPQVKQIVQVAEGLGVGAGDQLTKALRHGVATQSAMQDGLGNFFQFLDKYSKRLDAPQIPAKPNRRKPNR